MVALIRAVVTWFVIVNVLFLVFGLFGVFSIYEVLLVFAVSIALTLLTLRVWDRSRARRAGSATSV